MQFVLFSPGINQQHRSSPKIHKTEKYNDETMPFMDDISIQDMSDSTSHSSIIIYVTHRQSSRSHIQVMIPLFCHLLPLLYLQMNAEPPMKIHPHHQAVNLKPQLYQVQAPSPHTSKQYKFRTSRKKDKSKRKRKKDDK
jgi:hypothetical protein